MAEIELKLRKLGLELPELDAIGKIEPVKQVGKILFVSGHGPEKNGEAVIHGRVGDEVSLEQAYEAARLCALNCLALVKRKIGDLDKVDEFIKVLGFVNSAPDFHDQPKVMNGFTDLLIEVFGERGRHARSAIGTNNLPNNQPIEVEVILTVK
jgi:enamine deaminase RidA (YjgF/YER057c/UK114 family)